MSAIRTSVARVRGSLRRLTPLVDGRWGSVALIAVCSVGAGLAEAGVLSLIAYIATRMSSQGVQNAELSLGPVTLDAAIPSLLVAAAVLAAVRLGLQLVLAHLPVRLTGEVQTRLRGRLMTAYLGATWDAKAKEPDGRLQELMGSQTNQASSAVLALTVGLSTGLEFLMLVISSMLLNVAVSIGVMLTAAILFASLRPLSVRVRRRARATSAASVAQGSGVAESVRMAEEIQVFGGTHAERARMLGLVRTLEKRFVATRSLSRVVPALYQSAVMLLLIAGLAFLYVAGTTEVAALGAVVLLLIRASAYGQQLQVAYQTLGEAMPYLDRMTTTTASYYANERPHGLRSVPAIGAVTFDDVSFAYRPGVPVLRDVSFQLGPREAIGVVGPSGAGKSTLLQLLLRLRDPSSGEYLIDRVPARDIADDDWHRKVAFLPQEPHLLNDTVAQNIRFFRDWLDDAAVERAARLAHIHEDIMSWTAGYETRVGQRANAVSGGQRQRLCMARALAGSPDLLLLDEPTSSLDLRSERLIQESLGELRGELTLILVAHRLTTLSLCDRVMVVRGGRLESFEPTEQLYDSNDFYRQTVNLASAGGRPDV